MASILKVDTIQDQDGNNIINESANTITIGASGDTITIPSGATLANSGIITGFESTGIDDNATSTAITIDSGQRVRINNTTSTGHGNIYNLIVGNESSGGDSGILITAPNNENSYVSFGDSDGVPGLINYNHASNFLRTYINGSEAMRINSDGKVLIGTTSEPQNFGTDRKSLTIKSSSSGNYAVLQISGNATNNDQIQGIVNFYNDTTSVSRIDSVRASSASDANLRFWTAPSGGGIAERMRIDSSGNVGIGNTVASTINSANGTGNLVVGSGSGTEGITIYSGTTGEGTLQFADGTSGAATYVGQINYNHSSNFMSFGANASERMRIDSSGNVGIGTTSPQEKLDIDGNIAISGNTLFEEVTSGAGMPSSGGNKSVNTAYDSTFSLTAGKWLILVNASLQVFQSSSNESGLYLLSLSLGSSAGADDYGLIQKAVLKWGNGSNSYGDNSGGHFPTLTLGSTTTLHTRWYVTEYGTASNFWVRGNLTKIRCIRIG